MLLELFFASQHFSLLETRSGGDKQAMRRVIAHNCLSVGRLMSIMMNTLKGPDGKLCCISQIRRCRKKKKQPCAWCGKYEIIVRKIDEKRG